MFSARSYLLRVVLTHFNNDENASFFSLGEKKLKKRLLTHNKNDHGFSPFLFFPRGKR